jgi:hypothetical protein
MPVTYSISWQLQEGRQNNFYTTWFTVTVAAKELWRGKWGEAGMERQVWFTGIATS